MDCLTNTVKDSIQCGKINSNGKQSECAEKQVV